MSFSKKIVILRSEKEWSQADLAEKIGVHPQTVSLWERGARLADVPHLMKLSEIFQVTTDYLLYDGVPRDGRVKIPDLDLLTLFEDLCGLGDESRDLVKRFLTAFVFRERMKEELGGDEN